MILNFAKSVVLLNEHFFVHTRQLVFIITLQALFFGAPSASSLDGLVSIVLTVVGLAPEDTNNDRDRSLSTFTTFDEDVFGMFFLTSDVLAMLVFCGLTIGDKWFLSSRTVNCLPPKETYTCRLPFSFCFEWGFGQFSREPGLA